MSPEFQLFVDSFPNGTEERQYFEAAAEIVAALDLEMNDVVAFGCIWFLDMSTIELVDGRLVGSPLSPFGDVGDICRLIAIKFSSINSDPEWWHAAYRWTRRRGEVGSLAREILAKTRVLPFVKRVETSLK